MLAEALEGLYTSSPTLQEMYLEDLAYHCYEAGMWEQALVYTQEVGEKALALYAQQAAIEHFTRAVDAEHHLSIPIVTSPLSFSRAGLRVTWRVREGLERLQAGVRGSPE